MKSVKKCCLILFVFFLFATSAYAIDAPAILAGSAILVEPSSGEILYEKNSHDKAYPASTTKMMTALLAIEKGVLTDAVTIKPSAIQGLDEMGSGANLHAGDTYTLRDLLYLLLLSSENDSANAIAEHIAGSQEAFVQMMNQRAKELGMTGTHFANAHGLHDDNHYTTAFDLYLLAKEGLKNDLFAQITSTARAVIKGHEILTTNNLISRFRDPNYYYQYASGIKTGFTTPAGYCLVSVAQKNGQKYICVVMGSKTDKATGKIGSFTDTKALYEWAFNNFERKKLVTTSTPLREVQVRLAKSKDFLVLTPSADLSAIVEKGFDPKTLSYDYKINQNITAPVKKGDVLGKVTISANGKTFGTLNLVALSNVDRSTYLYVLDRVKAFFFNIIFVIALILLIILVILVLVFRVLNRRRRRKRGYNRRYGGPPRRR